MREFSLSEAMDPSTESSQDLDRAIEVLRLQGYEIDGDQTGGWTLVNLPDTINYLEIESSLKTTFLGKCLFAYRIIGSTNEAARQLAETGAPDGTLLVAEEQRKGRGRFGGSWYSPSGGGIWASLILRPGIRPAQLGSLPMLAALSICLAVEEHTGLKPQIKWPNDLYLNGKKLAGVLCEAGMRGDELKYVVLGFGINVNIERFPPELSFSATSLVLARAERKIYRVGLLAAILDKLEEGYFKFLTDGFASFLPRVQVRDFLRNRRIKVQLAGGEIVDGVSRGIDENGALLLETRAESHLNTLAQGHVIQF
ncbi:MAG TPA: biotin--[acetyl-CoA-carboxylase] ligase [archaeon]|nr:biotin--[acetyl-CoA-carboxylase] ligase [archaeon]